MGKRSLEELQHMVRIMLTQQLNIVRSVVESLI